MGGAAAAPPAGLGAPRTQAGAAPCGASPGARGQCPPMSPAGCPPYPDSCFFTLFRTESVKRPRSDFRSADRRRLVRLAVCPLRGTRVVASCRPRGSQSPRLSSAGHHLPWPPAPRAVPFPRGRRRPPTQHPGRSWAPSCPRPSHTPARRPGLARAHGLSGSHGDPGWLCNPGPCSGAGAQSDGTPAASPGPVASEAPRSAPSVCASLRSPSGPVRTAAQGS